MKKTYKIEVDCAACALKMEEAAGKVAGVAEATVSFMTQKMKVEFEEEADVKAVMEQVRKACKRVEADCEIFL
ncbi:MAG: cation transporter [Acetatifactor sp.]